GSIADARPARPPTASDALASAVVRRNSRRGSIGHLGEGIDPTGNTLEGLKISPRSYSIPACWTHSRGFASEITRYNANSALAMKQMARLSAVINIGPRQFA